MFLFDLQIKVIKTEKQLFFQFFFAMMSSSLILCDFSLQVKKVDTDVFHIYKTINLLDRKYLLYPLESTQCPRDKQCPFKPK